MTVNTMWFAALILGAIGVMAARFAAKLMRRGQRIADLDRHGRRVVGWIKTYEYSTTSSRARSSDRQAYPVVSFRGPDREYTGTALLPSAPADLRGDLVTVVYDPQRPSRFIIEGQRSATSTLFGGPGTVLAVAMAVALVPVLAGMVVARTVLDMTSQSFPSFWAPWWIVAALVVPLAGAIAWWAVHPAVRGSLVRSR